MRRLLCGAQVVVLLLPLGALTGCGENQKAKIPEKTMDVPKSGPVPAGAPGATGAAGKNTKGAAAD